jgi:hypothetical protein
MSFRTNGVRRNYLLSVAKNLIQPVNTPGMLSIFFNDQRTHATTKLPVFHYIYTKPNSPAPAKGYRAVW